MPENQPQFMFRLLAGTHIQRKPDGSRETVKKGGKFMASTRLDIRFGRDRYQLLNEPAPIQSGQSQQVQQGSTQEHLTQANPSNHATNEVQADQLPDFSSMDEEHLRDFAKEEGVDLKGLKKGDRDGIIKRIQQAFE